MIYKCGDPNFKYAWLDYLVQDPVQPNVSIQERITGTRTVFVWIEENEPQFLISAKLGSDIPRSMKDILSDDVDPDHKKEFATFYSIFRIPGSAMKGGGGKVIKEVIDYCKLRGTGKFHTLSPIPFLKNAFDAEPSASELASYLETKTGPVEKFHINNGATIAHVNYSADESELRMEESWGIMVNYSYNPHED